ncbi:MAG: hypothetical protein IKD36_02460 [Clostridia bacterium]|nr:hypothetical protein [Clostridia bacterium]
MARKVYTVEFDDVNLASTAGSKASKVIASEAEKEVENYGIVEINNNSAKKKVKSTREAGFEKNVTNASKKSVKATISKVDDYFDFSFRPTSVVKVEDKAEIKKATSKTTKAKTAAKPEIIDNAKACEIYTMTDEARKVVSVAREGSLFG